MTNFNWAGCVLAALVFININIPVTPMPAEGPIISKPVPSTPDVEIGMHTPLLDDSPQCGKEPPPPEED